MNNPRPDPARIKRITESIIGLPTLPTVVSKMIELVDNPKTSAASLAQLISTDQSLTAKILKMANSAYYGFPREISTVNMAIVVMGFNAVKDMGLSLSVFDAFKEAPASGHFDVNRFWEHSIGCGVAAKLLARRYYPRMIGEAFVAGLLHDIGKVVLNQYLHAEFNAIMTRTFGGSGTLDENELSIIGVSHGIVGGWLADKWRMPLVIAECIRFHHSPGDAARESVMAVLVCIADHICHVCHIGESGRPTPLPIPDDLWEILRSHGIAIEKSDLDVVVSEFLLELDRSDALLAFMHHDEGFTDKDTMTP